MQPFVPPEQRGTPSKPLHYRMLLVGAQGVGKYSLHHQFVYSVFPPIRDPFFDSESTELSWRSCDNVGNTYRINPARMNISKSGHRMNNPTHGDQVNPNTVVPLDIFRFGEADGMVLVYSIVSRTSFEGLQRFLKARNADAKAGVTEPKILCIIGNKLDFSKGKRKVLCIEGEELAQDYGASFVECSAKEQKGLEKVKSIITKAMDNQRTSILVARGQALPEGSRTRKKLSRASSYGNSVLSQNPSEATPIRSDTQRSSSSGEKDFAVQRPSERNGGDGTRSNGGPVHSFGTVPRHSMGPNSRSMYSESRIEEEEEQRTHSRSQTPVLMRASNDPRAHEQGNHVQEPASRSRWQLGSNEGSKSGLSDSGARSETKVPRPEIRASQSSSNEADKPKPEGLGITSPTQAASLGTLFQYKPPPKKDYGPPPSPQQQRVMGHIMTNLPAIYPFDTLDPFNPHPGTKVPLPSSVPPSRRQSFELTSPGALSSGRMSPVLMSAPSTTRNSDETLTPPSGMYVPKHSDPPQVEPISSPIGPRLELIPLPEGLQSAAQSSPSEERRKLEIERTLLEQERRKLKDQMARLADQREKLAERRIMEEERRKIEQERKQIEEERKKIQEEVLAMEEENRRMMAEEAMWNDDLLQRLENEHQKETTPSPVTVTQEEKTPSPVTVPQKEIIEHQKETIASPVTITQKEIAPKVEKPQRMSGTGMLDTNMDLITVNPNRLSKDDSFLEPPPRNPLRSATSLGFYSPQLGPTSPKLALKTSPLQVSNQFEASSPEAQKKFEASALQLKGHFEAATQKVGVQDSTSPTQDRVHFQFPRPQHRLQAETPSQFDGERFKFSNDTRSRIAQIEQKAAKKQAPMASSPAPLKLDKRSQQLQNVDNMRKFVRTNSAPAQDRRHFPYFRSSNSSPSPSELRAPPASTRTSQPTERQAGPFIRSVSDSGVKSLQSDISSLSDDGSVISAADYTARIIRINRVSRTFDSEPFEDITALPQKGRNNYPQPPLEKATSQTERLKRRDEEDRQDRRSSGNGYAVRATTLPPIIENEKSWSSSRPRLPYPGRYV